MDKLLEKKTRGVKLTTWIWKMVKEGQVMHSLGSRSAWVQMAIITQAKKDGIYKSYKSKVKEI